MNTRRKSHRPGGPGQARCYQVSPDTLRNEEVELLLRAAYFRGARDYALIFLTLNTGLRNAEVLGLNVEDVYFHEMVVKILDLPGRIAKGNKPRSIPLNSTVRKILQEYIGHEILHGRITDGSSPLFRSHRRNRRLGAKDFQQILERISIESIHRKCVPHMLRHTFATKLLQRSNIKIVQELLGHNSLQSTQIYLHPSSNDKAVAVDKLDFTPNQKD